jgi:capsular polysaccharide transport system ATP-binding protein
MGQVRDFCTSGLVLEGGRLQYFADLEEAIEAHRAIMARA